MRVPKKGLKRYGYEPEADYLRGTGAELAVACAGDGAGRPAAYGGEKGIPAKAGARSCRRHADGKGGPLCVCSPVQQVRRAGAPGWIYHRAGEGAANTGTCRRANNCTGNRTSALTAAGDEWTAAACSGRGVLGNS